MPALHPPALTVVMATYNRAAYLREALESLFSQTILPARFIVINDGSTDETVEVVRRFNEPRLHLISNRANLGTAFSLNLAFALVETQYVAMLDSDDIALPTRLEQQLDHMLRHPTVGVCGSYMEMFDTHDPTRTRLRPCPLDHDEIRCQLLFGNPMANSTAFLNRTNIPRRALRYRSGFAYADDYELWSRLSEEAIFSNLPEVLVRYRLHPTSITSLHGDGLRQTANRVRAHALRCLFKQITYQEIALHNLLCSTKGQVEESDKPALRSWLTRLRTLNQQTNHYPPEAFERRIVYWLGRLNAP